MMKFSDMKYQRPDIVALKEKLAEIEKSISSASCADAQIKAYKIAGELSTEYSTMYSLAYVRHTIDTTDEFYDAENTFFDEVGPEVSDSFLAVKKAMLASPFRDGLEKALGSLFFINGEIEARSFSTEIIPLAAEENRLASEYQKLIASATVEWEGDTIALTKLGKHKNSPDREIRRKAFLKDAEFFDNNREKLDELFDKLIKNRNEQAHRLGYKNYIALGYDRLGRNCYGPEKVAEFRHQIEKYIVPAVARLKEAQKERIGVEKLCLYDNAVIFPEGNPNPKGTPEQLLAAAADMYEQMSPRTAEFFSFMTENGLFDLLSAQGKAPGGYCTEFAAYKAPFIFSNFNGTAGDVDVLTHEAGHAFAYYVASRKGILDEYISPTIEACEVHSMSMEFLTSPYHEGFFAQETGKYTYFHAADALGFIPYGCMIDEFQHIAYENEDMTPEERNRVWLSLEEKYRPYLDVSDLPFYSRGGGWQRQLHVYLYPLYYIDYCMAQTVAFQFYSESLEDWSVAFEKYLAFVDGAGTKTFEDLVEGAGLTLPYKDGCLSSVADNIISYLEKLDI